MYNFTQYKNLTKYDTDILINLIYGKIFSNTIKKPCNSDAGFLIFEVCPF